MWIGLHAGLYDSGMSLQALYANVQQQRDQLSHQRQIQAEALTTRARELIDLATDEAFRDKARLSEAVELLMQAIQNHRQHVEAYLCLAYLCYLIGDNQTALVYLKDAQAIDPEHVIAQALKAEILKQRFTQPDSGTESQPLPSASADSDDSEEMDEDELQRAILEAVRRISSQQSPGLEPEQAFEPEAYQAARLFQQQLQTRHAGFETQISRLEREFDVMSLRQALRPLEVFLRRSQQQLQAARELLALQRQIQREIQLVTQIQDQIHSAQTPEALNSLERKLEQSLDQSDMLADQLDTLDGRGGLPPGLLQEYEQLAALSQEVMDALDDKSTR